MSAAQEDESATALLWVTASFCACCAFGAVYLWRHRVILTASRIEAGSLRLRGLDRHDIAGYRLIPTPSGTRVLVMPRDPVHHRRIEFVAEAIQVDEALTDWIDGLPNLDEAPVVGETGRGQDLTSLDSQRRSGDSYERSTEAGSPQTARVRLDVGQTLGLACGLVSTWNILRDDGQWVMGLVWGVLALACYVPSGLVRITFGEDSVVWRRLWRTQRWELDGGCELIVGVGGRVKGRWGQYIHDPLLLAESESSGDGDRRVIALEPGRYTNQVAWAGLLEEMVYRGRLVADQQARVRLANLRW